MDKLGISISDDRVNTQYDIPAPEVRDVLYDRFRHPKKQKKQKNSSKVSRIAPLTISVFDYKRLLAAAEDRYRSDTQELLTAIKDTKSVYDAGIVGTWLQVHSLQKKFNRILIFKYWTRWKTDRNFVEFQKIMTKLFRMWRRNIKIRMITALYQFRENSKSFYVLLSHDSFYTQTNRSFISHMTRVFSPIKLASSSRAIRSGSHLVELDLTGDDNPREIYSQGKY